MELYTKDELNTLKELIEEAEQKETFKDTLECIDNCTKLLSDDEHHHNDVEQ